MSHLMNWPSQKRISLESVHVLPGGKIQVACWGMCAGLEFIATTDEDWGADIASNVEIQDKAKYALGTKLTASQCKVTDLPSSSPTIAVKQFQFFEVGPSMTARIILKMGSAVWDWMRVHVKTNVPAEVSQRVVTSGTLNAEVLWAVPQGYGLNSLPHAATVARIILGRHGLNFNLKSGTAFDAQRSIAGFEGGVIASYESWGNLNRLANRLKEHGRYSPSTVMVIMANLREESIQNGNNHLKLAGVTVSRYQQVNPFIVLNANVASVDGGTLVHEMGHAAGFCDEDNKTVHSGVSSHFMSYGTMRNESSKGSIEGFRKSFFWSAN